MMEFARGEPPSNNGLKRAKAGVGIAPRRSDRYAINSNVIAAG